MPGVRPALAELVDELAGKGGGSAEAGSVRDRLQPSPAAGPPSGARSGDAASVEVAGVGVEPTADDATPGARDEAPVAGGDSSSGATGADGPRFEASSSSPASDAGGTGLRPFGGVEPAVRPRGFGTSPAVQGGARAEAPAPGRVEAPAGGRAEAPAGARAEEPAGPSAEMRADDSAQAGAPGDRAAPADREGRTP
jgi:hypothetical protein